MKRAIWKYEIPIQDRTELQMPTGADILSIQVQKGIICLWALVDPTAEKEGRVFHLIGTGRLFNKHGLKYITSVQTHGDTFIWHLFDGGKY